MKLSTRMNTKKEDTMRKFELALLALFTALILVLGVFPLAVSAVASPNAAIVATSGQTISGHVKAAGHDVGIYIGKGVQNVTVKGATVSGAGFIGILVQDAHNILIEDSTISGNGADPSIIPNTEYKGIVLAGTTNCVVKGNTVKGNLHGGISVLDDGPNQPFYVSGIPMPSATPGTENVIMGNTVKDNLGDCGIVVSGKNAGAGVSNTVVWNNTVIGSNHKTKDSNPAVGGIVLGTGFVGASTVTDTIILNNEVDGGVIPGISVHCGAYGPGLISGTQIIDNALSNNGDSEFVPSGGGIGIEFFAIPGAVITGTQVLYNTIWDSFHITGVSETTATQIQPVNQ
jgi:parallel beta-helix repeat protein